MLVRSSLAVVRVVTQASRAPQQGNAGFSLPLIQTRRISSIRSRHELSFSSPLTRLAPTSRRAYATTGSSPKKTPKSSTAKTPAKKTASKKKTTKAAKKPAAKKRTRAKKVLTEADKEAAKEKKAKALIRELRKVALKEPKSLPDSAWTVLNAEASKESHSLQAPQAAEKYKLLSPAEREHYNHIANQNKATNEATYKAWVASHTVEQINAANNARRMLKRRLNRTRGFPQLKDDRIPKQPTSPYIQFYLERVESGDLRHMSVADMARLVSAEWKGLTASEKQTYQDAGDREKARYKQQVRAVFNRDVTPPKTSKATS